MENPEKKVEMEFFNEHAKKSKYKVRNVTRQVFSKSLDEAVEITIQNSSDE